MIRKIDVELAEELDLMYMARYFNIRAIAERTKARIKRNSTAIIMERISLNSALKTMRF